MSGLEEDKAEVYASFFVTEEWLLVSKWLEADSVLRNKVRYMKDFLREKSKNLDEKYWIKLHEKKEEKRNDK